MRAWLERRWYGEARRGDVLLPLAALFGGLVRLRRAAFARGLLARVTIGRPVVVIGNLTVGGSGKTPLTAWLVGELAAQGVRAGIVSRGHGGTATGPLRVDAATDPRLAGDEPVLLARRTGAPVAVGRDRVAAARLLVPEVDVVVADDGLQHYRLARDFEIVVVDGRRRFGNGRLLPAGPLREPLGRAQTADLVVVNGGPAGAGEFAMTLEPGDVVALPSGSRRPLREFAGQRVHAVAGIGDPARFFATLRAAGVVPIEHPLPDHAALTPADLDHGDGLPVLMTEKDAVKCGSFAPAGSAWLEVSARFAPADATLLVGRVLAILPRH
jgi:tetraacyldisaccharide 4'-kinase